MPGPPPAPTVLDMGASGTVDLPVTTTFEAVVTTAQAQTRVLGNGALRVDAGGAGLPSRIGGWRVHDVLVHLGGSMNRLARAVREPGARVRQVTLAEYCSVPAAAGEEVRRRVAEEAAFVALDHSGPLLAQAAGRLCRALDAVEGDKIVVMRRGTLPLSELLGLHCLETLGHLGDLASAAGVPASDLSDPRAVRLAAHMLGAGDLPTRPDVLAGPLAGRVGRLCPAAG